MQFNSKKINLVVSILLVLVLGAAVFLFFPTKKHYATSTDQRCPGDVYELEMPDGSMDGLLKQNQKFKVTQNWYACNPLERGDLVYYRFSTSNDPIVRVLRAIPGDEFEVLRDEKYGAWNIKVNSDMVMDKASGEPYYFGAKPTATLSLYEKANKGKLQEGDVIVLSNVPPGSNDSGLFGVANVADIVGKVEVVSE
jgi:signal peptidase S26 family